MMGTTRGFGTATAVAMAVLAAACADPAVDSADGGAGSDGGSPGATGDGRDVPGIAEERCDKTYVTGPSAMAGTAYYAEHPYPGKTKFEIAAHVTHWVPIVDPNRAACPLQYAGGLNAQTAVYARDGFAGAGCEAGTVTYFIWK
jgi:hypothetical protein